MTIIAIFLALGVGMVIGGAYVHGPLVDRLTKQLDGLRHRFDSEIVPLRDGNQRYEQFLERLSPALMRDRLRGKRISLVQTGDYPEELQRAKDLITEAGATVANSTVIRPDFLSRTTEALPDLTLKVMPRYAGLPADTSAPLFVLASILNKGDLAGDIALLSDANLIDRDGDYLLPVDTVVIVGGGIEKTERQPELIDRRLCEALRARQIRIIGVEPEDAGHSYVPIWSAASGSTIDNLNSRMGQIAFVLLLDPKQERGDYGVKPTARSGLAPSPAP